MRRSMLFLPGNSPKMIVNGLYLHPDSIILDLEDAVSPDEKDAARDLVRHALSDLDFGGRVLIVRINALDTPYWEADLETVIPRKPDMIMPTKVSGGAYIRTLDEKITQLEQKAGLPIGNIRIIALLETAADIEHAYEIACASPRMEALYLGAEDLSADLRCPRTKEGTEILYARGRLVCAARVADIKVDDTPFTDVEDLAGLEADTRLAKSLGFSGKAVISPRHIEAVNRLFSPSADEVRYAHAVLAAIEEAKRQGKGAASLNGKMIDAPIVLRAKQVLEAAELISQQGGGIGE